MFGKNSSKPSSPFATSQAFRATSGLVFFLCFGGCQNDPTIGVTGISSDESADTGSLPDSESEQDSDTVSRIPGLLGGPVPKSTDEFGFVIVPDMRVPSGKYQELASALSAGLPFVAYVKVADFPLDVPNSLLIKSAVEDQAKAIRSQAKDLAGLYVLGHGEGGQLLQDFTANRPNAYDGQVLLGSTLKRSYYDKPPKTPTLTVGAELDGVSYITRHAEAFHKTVELAADSTAAALVYPHVLIEGMSHAQFASGKPAGFAEGKDLIPELELDQAHRAIADILGVFVRYTSLGDASAGAELSTLVEQAAQRYRPIIEAMEMEGTAHFKPPCNCAPLTCPESDTCQARNPWTEIAQEYMGGLDLAKMSVRDSFHPVSEVTPIHLPKIYNTCEADDASCVLEVTTVSENVYTDGDNNDDGRSPVTASEIRAKLMSRQSVYLAVNRDAVFSETDTMFRCAEINLLSWQWALQKAHPIATSRFDKWGVPMRMGQDMGPYNMGPMWIWTALSYETQKGLFEDGLTEVMMVSSPSMVTPVDFAIASAAGFHYCKLLSPARALEWIYVDGLRSQLTAK